MYDAILLICTLTVSGPADPCVEIVDARGPYHTEEQCNARLEEMKMDINENPIYNFMILNMLNFPDLLGMANICLDDGSVSI
jgi:hypothetical protein